MAPLLDPQETVLVAFIDSLKSENQPIDFYHSDNFNSNSAIFMIAEAASVPSVLISDDAYASTSTASPAESATCRCELPAKSWETTQLGQKLAKIGRPSLLFADSNISSFLCIAALGAYASGYDVYCMTFTGVPPTTPEEALTCQRLQHTGIVVVTIAQVLCEWIAHFEDNDVRRTLLQLQTIVD